MNKNVLSVLLVAALSTLQAVSQPKSKTIAQKLANRDFPSIFMAWYNIDMPEFPVATNDQRIEAAAKHDLIWEEPLSQLGEGVDLVLGLVWDHQYHGLASSFEKKSLEMARQNKAKLLAKNPEMLTLFEVRWRDAPKSFLPESSPWWLRDEKGVIKKGWLGGWEPFYLLDANNPNWQDNVARQCKIAIESGIYDGVMFDWSGNLEIIKKTRAAIGEDALIIVNIHDDIDDGRKYAPYINGAFMELNPIDSISIPVEELKQANQEDRNGRKWDNIRDAVKWFQDSLRAPQVVCNEVWGHRKDLSRMRAVTTMTMVYSNGYALYADPNPLKTPDHLHDWYPFWDAKLGKPTGKYVEMEDKSAHREFQYGTVVYNHYGNKPAVVKFNDNRKRVSDGLVGKEFVVNGRDGEIFLKIK